MVCLGNEPSAEKKGMDGTRVPKSARGKKSASGDVLH